MNENTQPVLPSFYERPNVQSEILPIAEGVKVGIERVTNSALGLGGAYGGWGDNYDNEALPGFVGGRLDEELPQSEVMNLSELGFQHRMHLPNLSQADHLAVEVEVGARLIRAAAEANGWQLAEIDGLLVGMSAPVSEDYVVQIARRAGMRADALKVSVHKACDGSMGALNLAINPELALPGGMNVAQELAGKKVLVGGIEGLSRFTSHARDKNALQLFGNGMGLFGVVPGENMKLLAGRSYENYDQEGLLQVRMYYPHSKEISPGKSLLEIQQDGSSHIRVAGMMHEPADGLPIVMAGLMGMVKLFVRSGVEVVTDVHQQYQALMEKLGQSGREINVAIVHHANYKINLLKAKQLLKAGINFPMPWLLHDFGNVSAASCAIAFLRQLQDIKPGDHLLFDGFGAGTYYDVMAVSMG
ncbi:MAG: 3-oxoacyl-[acyl-carrier-protein] synthase III C-terminal domain-containing protein [Anaerolineales bacterium]|jgi:3-oxoacyl-[acyl-carrier-protein] synthase III|nr:3-oxoacyl-[acyl-carrier-protein] synthase III C-terminal domain-containing protein [Anaerolineales bacterium]